MAKTLLVSASFLLLQASIPVLAQQNSSCRCIPSDPCWPSENLWNGLNTTVNGNLIKTVPIGSVCRDPNYNAQLCNQVQAKWEDPDWRTSLSESVLSPSFANNSCDPFGPRNQPCQVGGYAPYSIKVTDPKDISAGLDFAKQHNIRVVVKNTGHDYLGRSVGHGSLSLWTHNLKDMKFIQDYKGKSYQGPAVKVLAGAQVLETYEFVNKLGYMVVGGECKSVGLAGGFTSGGGQSPLSSYAGLAADQTLEFEVVTTDGQLLRAAPDQNPDLFWALSGGGPGYGVVWSVTYKVYKDVPVTGARLSFASNSTSEDAFWKAIDFWHSLVPNITDLGGYTYTTYSKESFSMEPLFVPNRTRLEVENLIQPFHKALDTLGIAYRSSVTTYSTYLEAWKALIGQEGAGETSHQGTRLLSRKSLVETPEKTSNVTRTIANAGVGILEMAIGATASKAGNPDNSVNPGWRTSDVLLFISSPNENSKGANIDEQVTVEWGGMLRDLSPETGTYMNEADVYQLDFQKEFYGVNYGRLSSIKKKYDPDSLFYATTAVGSEQWVPRPDGRLCRV